ncbi:autotransporter outer membrane beta-barrel domain-containing protein [Campylobacter lari]|uniref:autotransporter outer membrane beta-barrel domain-containing protein n=2 Tax=Campylobacter lari TaxID=201 RepID=UPI00127BCC67|nr:autotransporter outer membrane beta-barrel domain-containing protein [Campylobacter lari]EAH8201046.1 autotransporter outer membrane beta-barrel domain-containing protein [Campylobacter lari]EAK0433656.1 autotransporter outer membrane beta-barrel domain-containing protein [Campylobacter lari]EKN1198716.1 autotransporter outer membrane beta-barrel domain-containing protein [Campylobacter lari]ELV3596334.1 autotransporter outer membrane beta-barrel domain-containing protein [Campylobacter lari
MKKLNRKIFLSACVATFVASSAMAIEPSNPIPGAIEDSQLTHLGGGEYQFVISKPQEQTFYISNHLGDNDYGQGAVLETPIKHLTINAANNTIVVGGKDVPFGSIGGIKPHYSFAIKAKEVNFIGKKNPDNVIGFKPYPVGPNTGADMNNPDNIDDGFGAIFNPDTGINSGALTDRNPWGPTWIQDSRENVSLNVFHDGLIDGNVNMDHANFKIIAGDFNGINYNGALTINGNLFAHDSLFTLHGPHQFTVNGNAVIRNSVFELANFSNPVTEKGVYLLSATNFNKEFAEVNTVRNVLLIPEGKILGLKGHALAEYEGEVVKVIIDQDKKYFNYKLNVIGNDAYAQGGLTSGIKNINISDFLKEMRIEVLTQLHDYYAQKAYEQNQQHPGIDPKVDYDKILADIKKEMNNITNNQKVITYGHQIDSVLASLKNSDRHLAANSALVNAIKGDVRQAQAIVDSARESANNSNRQGAIQVINLANEMAIATRMAQSRGAGENSVWANAFGGANIIGSDSEGVYGTTIGIDRQFNDAIFFGAYLTYADSQLNHNSLNQDSNNLQLGLYSRIANGQHEFDIKSYAQFSFADQERFVNGSVQKSDFTQTYLGASGSYGYVFDFSDNFSIKPLIGLNLYYSHTPDYTESGIWAQKVYSMDSFAASAELGAEFRKFFSGGSYFYVTPKIEQFFAMSGDNFKARFTGSDFSYNVAGAEKDKTFGKILIGSNISVTDRFSIDLSVGAKQILGNKDDNTDETYVTGNIGVKYSF